MPICLPPARVITPKVLNRFRVLFVSDENLISDTEYLTFQTVSISLPKLVLTDKKWVAAGSAIRIVFEDDVENRALTAVQRLVDSNRFSVAVLNLDGDDNALSEYTFNDCYLRTLSLADLDYSAGRGAAMELEIGTSYSEAQILVKECK